MKQSKPAGERLQKVLASRGLGSRREIEGWISEGRISVNGKPAVLGTKVVDSDKIIVDGNELAQSQQNFMCRVLMYNKPEGELCSRSDPEGRPTVFERMPRISDQRWITVGRLDINTSGLLLLTNDGELANRLMHPSHEVDREYAVRVFGEVSSDALKRLKSGVELEDGMAKFDTIAAGSNDLESLNSWYNVTLKEGRNREVRRLWESQGLQVSRLIRVRYGNLELYKRLPQGAWIELDLATVNQLRTLVQLPNETQSKVLSKEKLDHTKLSRMRRSVRKHKQNKVASRPKSKRSVR